MEFFGWHFLLGPFLPLLEQYLIDHPPKVLSSQSCHKRSNKKKHVREVDLEEFKMKTGKKPHRWSFFSFLSIASGSIAALSLLPLMVVKPCSRLLSLLIDTQSKSHADAPRHTTKNKKKETVTMEEGSEDSGVDPY